VKALDRKLLRDLWLMKGQALAVTLVVLSGVGAFIMFISTMDSLNLTRERYYRDYAFSDVFVSLKRAPESVRAQIADLPGVGTVETRVTADVKLDVKGFPEPVTARIVSIPDNGRPLLNRLHLCRGRLVDPSRDDEAVVSESFARAPGFRVGDRFGAVINGRWKTLTITGMAMSPEFVLQMRPEAASPDFKRYGIVWMGRRALARAYDMEGAFNDLVLALAPGADLNEVIARLDRILDRYGSLGAYGRKDQLSHRLMTDEFRQLKRASEIFPAIFIFVSAFLLNVVLSRIVSTQREQIAALKAFGYSNTQVGLHYSKLVVVITLAGVGGGILGGIRMGKILGAIYVGVYRFPALLYTLRPSVVAAAALITVCTALLGTLHAVWSSASQPPAEALRPEPLQGTAGPCWRG
jgi:putative ABC transport system permease protein